MTDAGRLQKVRRQITGPADLWLVIRMTVWCCALRMLKHVIALPSLVALARTSATKRASSPSEREKVVTLARWISRFTRVSSRGPCLERGLITYRYLTAIGAQPTLVVGFAPGAAADAPIRGHAWVTMDGHPVDETPESLADFHAVVAFEADGHRLPA